MAEAPGGMATLGPASIAPARFVLRSHGIGSGIMARLDDAEAAAVSDEIAERTALAPASQHPAIARQACYEHLDFRATTDDEPLTIDKSSRILRSAIDVHHLARQGYDRAWGRLEESREQGASDTDLAAAMTDVVHADLDVTAAAHRREQAMWDNVYLTDPDAFWGAVHGEPAHAAAALSTADRFDSVGYPGAVGACAGPTS